VATDPEWRQIQNTRGEMGMAYADFLPGSIVPLR
jgi:hypothetical protein